MLTHADVIKALTRAITSEGFTVIQDRKLPYRPENEPAGEIRFVRSDRVKVEAHRDEVLPLRFPSALVTNIDVIGPREQEGRLDDPAVEVEITYHLPYPAKLPVEAAIQCMNEAYEYLLDMLAESPPPSVAQEDFSPADQFRTNCFVSLDNASDYGVELFIATSAVIDEDDLSSEAELEGACEALMAEIAHVWRILVPEGYEHDPLAPLSFLVMDSLVSYEGVGAAEEAVKEKSVDPLVVSDGTKELAAYVAMVVRSEMENFHVEHLSDAQMAELNPIIRNAICTALHAYLILDDSVEARSFADFHKALIPAYWEEPRLTDSYGEFVEYQRTGKLPSNIDPGAQPET